MAAVGTQRTLFQSFMHVEVKKMELGRAALDVTGELSVSISDLEAKNLLKRGHGLTPGRHKIKEVIEAMARRGEGGDER